MALSGIESQPEIVHMTSQELHMATAPKYAGVEVDLSGAEKNSFDTISAVRRALMQAGVPFVAATEYTDKAMHCSTYEELLRVTRETVEVT